MPEKTKKPESSEKTKTDDKEFDHDIKKPIEDGQKEEISKPVVLKAEAYKTIILYASRYANQNIPPPQWKEIYGILIGTADDDFVYVERAEALTYGHSTDVQLDEQHYGFIEEIELKLIDEGKNHYMVGWFHSHPGLNLFFSYIDLLNQLGFQQNNPDFCGLVFDHTLVGQKKEEKIKGDDGVEHSITKFDTGFEIYRLIDVNMDINSAGFDENYHKVDYVVDGLNKFFFANVLSELSALVSAGKPLQSAYGEQYQLESSYTDKIDSIVQKEETINNKFELDTSLNKEALVEIPISDNMVFDVDDLFYYDTNKKERKKAELREAAEESIYEGNLAFKQKDAFMGVQKYRVAIDKYKKLNDYDRVFELLRNLSEHCIMTNHQILAEEFAEELFNVSIKQDHLFYRGEANYLIGYLMLKKGDDHLLEDALKRIQQASIDYEKAGDYAGAGGCYNKIGTIYQSRLNQPFNAALFYTQAIRSLNEAILRGHPLRKALWSKSESLPKKILEIKDIVEELISRIQNPDDREKIKNDLKKIEFNF